MIKQLIDLKNRLGENPELKPIYFGFLNFATKNKTAEFLAKKRYFENCKNCINFVDEENDLLKIEDKKIPELSNKMCNLCGCVASYKLRQSINKCEQWQK